MELRFLVLAAVVGVAGCDRHGAAARDAGVTADLGVGGDEGVPADLSVLPPPADLSAGDLAVARDLAVGPDMAGPPDVVTQLPGVTVATLAGSSVAGSIDAVGAAARFDNPVGIALAPGGLLYVTEYDGNRIRTLTPDGTSGTVVADVTTPADFACPFAIAIIGAGKLLVQTDCDITGNKDVATSVLWTVDVATGTPTPLVQGLGRPRGLVLVDASHVAVSDRTYQTLQLLTVANGTLAPLAGAMNMPGFANGSGAAARFDGPYGLALLPDGAVVVADSDNHRLRRVALDGTTSTLAGSGTAGTADAHSAAAARFVGPKVVAVDAAGDVYVSDASAHRIRRVRANGVVETIAGDGVAGFRDGAGGQAEFYGQEGIAVTADGKTVYVTDGNGGDGMPYHRIRVITVP